MHDGNAFEMPEVGGHHVEVGQVKDEEPGAGGFPLQGEGEERAERKV